MRYESRKPSEPVPVWVWDPADRVWYRGTLIEWWRPDPTDPDLAHWAARPGWWGSCSWSAGGNRRGSVHESDLARRVLDEGPPAPRKPPALEPPPFA